LRKKNTKQTAYSKTGLKQLMVTKTSLFFRCLKKITGTAQSNFLYIDKEQQKSHTNKKDSKPLPVCCLFSL
jgi:hypothetical protein